MLNCIYTSNIYWEILHLQRLRLFKQYYILHLSSLHFLGLHLLCSAFTGIAFAEKIDSISVIICVTVIVVFIRIDRPAVYR